MCPDPNRNEGTRGHAVGFAVKVTDRDEPQVCNGMQAHRGEVSCRSLVALADYAHAMHVGFDAMPVMIAFCGASVAYNVILIIPKHDISMIGQYQWMAGVGRNRAQSRRAGVVQGVNVEALS